MKKYTFIIVAAIACVALISCGKKDKEETVESVVEFTSVDGDEYVSDGGSSYSSSSSNSNSDYIEVASLSSAEIDAYLAQYKTLISEMEKSIKTASKLSLIQCESLVDRYDASIDHLEDILDANITQMTDTQDDLYDRLSDKADALLDKLEDIEDKLDDAEDARNDKDDWGDDDWD